VNNPLLWAALASVAAAGCAPSLATMQPAHVGPKGSIQVTAAVEVAIPPGAIIDAIDAGETISDRAANGQPISDTDRARLFNAAINLLASPPSFGPHFAVAYAVLDRVEVGLRYAGQGWRLGGRYQLVRRDEGPCDLVVGLGLARSSYAVPLGDVIPVIQIDDFTRWTIDVPLTAGTSRSWFHVWAGPKLVYSHFDTAMRLVIPNEAAELASFAGHSIFFGGLAGVAVGYRHVFLGLELTVGHISGSATAAASTAGASYSAELSGTIVYPAFGLMGEF
jgi:hypothetical protein